MKRSISILVAGAVLATISIAQANPITGDYQGPGMLSGRWSESYIGGGQSEPNNEIRAGSWDGATLGGQWLLSGAILSTDTLESNQTFPYGLQVLQYYSTYTGGTLTLESGLWTAGGDGNYTVDLTNFSLSTIVVLVGGVVKSVTGTITMQGTFPAYSGYAVDYLLAVTDIVGEGSSAPAGYPSLSAAQGQWGGAQGVQMRIVPEPGTLCLLALGGLALMRRRRR